MKVIASLEIKGIKPDGENINIIAKIGEPYPVKGHEDIDEWACPVSSNLYIKGYTTLMAEVLYKPFV